MTTFEKVGGVVAYLVILGVAIFILQGCARMWDAPLTKPTKTDTSLLW